MVISMIFLAAKVSPGSRNSDPSSDGQSAIMPVLQLVSDVGWWLLFVRRPLGPFIGPAVELPMAPQHAVLARDRPSGVRTRPSHPHHALIEAIVPNRTVLVKEVPD